MRIRGVQAGYSVLGAPHAPGGDGAEQRAWAVLQSVTDGVDHHRQANLRGRRRGKKRGVVRGQVGAGQGRAGQRRYDEPAVCIHGREAEPNPIWFIVEYAFHEPDEVYEVVKYGEWKADRYNVLEGEKKVIYYRDVPHKLAEPYIVSKKTANRKALVLEKFGFEMQDKTPSVLGGILKLGLLVVRYPEPDFQVEDPSENVRVAKK